LPKKAQIEGLSKIALQFLTSLPQGFKEVMGKDPNMPNNETLPFLKGENSN